MILGTSIINLCAIMLLLTTIITGIVGLISATEGDLKPLGASMLMLLGLLIMESMNVCNIF